jgi:hypothetical protein
MGSFLHLLLEPSLSTGKNLLSTSQVLGTLCVHTLYFLGSWRQEEVTALYLHGVGVCGGLKRVQGY